MQNNQINSKIKTVSLELSQVNIIPNSLRANQSQNIAMNSLEIPILRLAHHDYLDSHNVSLPESDLICSTKLIYTWELSSYPELRFKNKGPGIGDRKVAGSERWGRAMCRLILSDHFNIRFFADIEEVINKSPHPAWNNFEIRRRLPGDLPDYFCAESVNSYYFAEAKGSRNKSMTVGTQYFNNWLQQFNRIVLRNKIRPIATKGYLVGFKLANEQKLSRMPKVLVHDPVTYGLKPDEDDKADLCGQLAIRYHYANVLRLLGFESMADSLIYIDSKYDKENDIFIANIDGFPKEEKFVIGNQSMIFNPFFHFHIFQPYVFAVRLETIRWLKDAIENNNFLEIPKFKSYTRGNLSLIQDGTVLGASGYFKAIEISNIKYI